MRKTTELGDKRAPKLDKHNRRRAKVARSTAQCWFTPFTPPEPADRIHDAAYVRPANESAHSEPAITLVRIGKRETTTAPGAERGPSREYRKVIADNLFSARPPPVIPTTEGDWDRSPARPSGCRRAAVPPTVRPRGITFPRPRIACQPAAPKMYRMSFEPGLPQRAARLRYRV